MDKQGLSQDEMAIIGGVSVLGLLAWFNRERVSAGLARWLLEHDVLVHEELVVTITAGAGLDFPRLLIAVGGSAVLLLTLLVGVRARMLQPRRGRETE